MKFIILPTARIEYFTTRKIQYSIAVRLTILQFTVVVVTTWVYQSTILVGLYIFSRLS
jgi:hypothetical protein